MIQITRKEECTGCEACSQICPKKCIEIHGDNEGFIYPYVREVDCIHCNLCDAVCPVINQESELDPLCLYGAINKDKDVRMQSSSGGIFTLLAEHILEKKGVVFGVSFDSNYETVHTHIEKKEELAQFRGSKYVQSRVGDSFVQVAKFLKKGRHVLFSGTPCQIAGLNKYLRRPYKNLLLIDFVCHGVPSPLVWRKYLHELREKRDFATIDALSFRDKSNSWKYYDFKIEGSTSKGKFFSFAEFSYNNLYMKGFLNDLYLRPSCHECPAKSVKSRSDITLADFWGVENTHPHFNDDRGVSLLIVNSEKGEEYLQSIDAELIKVSSSEIPHGFKHSPCAPPRREAFFTDLQTSTSVLHLLKCYTIGGRMARIKFSIRSSITQLLGRSRLEKIKLIIKK